MGCTVMEENGSIMGCTVMEDFIIISCHGRSYQRLKVKSMSGNPQLGRLT